ncbi:MAG: BlaI/MecI/CopY family transcriptional regulator [Eubacterium sp.]|nr:BlaI/MecI/CopY family transcriptional regulator [Eubacterium sp.]
MKTPQKVLEPLGIKKLSNTEMQFMEVIWEHPQGIKSEEIYAKFSQALGTKSTILHRIAGKGLVTTVRSGKHHIYIPKVTKEEYRRAFFREQMEREFGITSFEGLAAAFCGRTTLRPEEKERIGQLLEELKRNEAE